MSSADTLEEPGGSSPAMGFGAFVRVLAGYMAPYPRECIAVLLLLLLNSGFAMAWPLGFRVMVDRGIVERDSHALVVTLAVMLVGVVLVAMSRIGQDYLFASLGSRVVHDIRVRVFAHLQRMSPGFYARYGTGDLMARFSSDLAALDAVVTWVCAYSILHGLVVVFCTGALFFLEWRLASVTVVGLVICAVVPRRLASQAAGFSYLARQQEALLANTVQENIHSQLVVNAFEMAPRAEAAFAGESRRLAKTSQRLAFRSSVSESLPNLVILVAQVVVAGFGVMLVYLGRQTIGELMSIQALFVTVSNAVETLTSVVPVLLRSTGGVQRIENLLAEEPAIVDAPGAADLPRLAQGIEFRDVVFRYGGETAGIQNVCLTIPRGSSVAFVGGSGSGKSTLISLMLRFYDAQSGAVLFDGRDIRAVTLSSMRRQTGVVFQESFLLNVSIRENIRCGRPEATHAEVEAAAKAAGIHETVLSLPNGYDTLAGERGTRLSGGQRQRIAIARALLREPELLVLDEPTSALDPATEAAVNETLARATRGHTTVTVTHRLASVTHADTIFVMERGVIVERGRHEELLRQDGQYRALWAKQSGFTLHGSGEASVDPERLRSIPVLQALDAETLAAVAGDFATEQVEAGQRVVEQGEPGTKLYIIVRGRVSVTQAAADGVERRLDVLQDGDYFGEIALLENVPRTATIRTLTPCTFLTLARRPFNSLLQRSPHLRDAVMRTSAQRRSAPAAAPGDR